MSHSSINIRLARIYRQRGFETASTSIQISGSGILSATAGWDTDFTLDGYQFKTWGGLQLTGGVGVSGSGSIKNNTCKPPSSGVDICVAINPQFTVRGGAEVRLQLAWWSWTVGAQAFGQLQMSGKLCWACEEDGCSFEKAEFGDWQGDIGVRFCAGVCYTYTL